MGLLAEEPGTYAKEVPPQQDREARSKTNVIQDSTVTVHAVRRDLRKLALAVVLHLLQQFSAHALLQEAEGEHAGGLHPSAWKCFEVDEARVTFLPPPAQGASHLRK